MRYFYKKIILIIILIQCSAVQAGIIVKIGGEIAAVANSSDQELLNLCSTKHLFFEYGFTSNWDTQGGLSGKLTEATYVNGYYSEINPVIAPKEYAFTVSYDKPGLHGSAPVYWKAFIGFSDDYGKLPGFIYIYNQQLPYLTLNYGETKTGTIIVSDVGQTTRLELVSGDGQTYFVGHQFPQKLVVRVVKNEMELLAGKQVVFSLKSAPVGGQVAFTAPNTDTNVVGTAETFFTLSGPAGDYVIKASCADCAQQKEVLFNVHAEDILELQCVTCGLSGKVGEEIRNPFKFLAFNRLTGKPEAGHRIDYSAFSFTDLSSNTILGPDNGASLRVFNGVTDIYGFSRVYLKLGSELGTYSVRALCTDCLANQEQIARGVAFGPDWINGGDALAVPTANPDSRDPACSSDCCPLTPVIRIARVTTPNGGATFTSDGEENRINLQADLLPRCLDRSAITWGVQDAPDDHMNSGIPAAPGTGEVSYFTVEKSILPAAPEGRPLPLAYKITAGINYSGFTFYANKTVKQDEIDKCRQEYLDFEIPLVTVQRGLFTLGVGDEPKLV